jgi:hypothetical protein
VLRFFVPGCRRLPLLLRDWLCNFVVKRYDYVYHNTT